MRQITLEEKLFVGTPCVIDTTALICVDGKELMLIIFATILSLCDPTGAVSPNSALIYLGVIRIILGIGIGGDYPMSASVTSDRSNLYKRGTMLAYIFSNQGWGSLAGSLVTMAVLGCYKSVMHDKGETSKVDGGTLITDISDRD